MPTVGIHILLLTLPLIATLPTADAPKKAPVQPIKVVILNHKEPVVYEKEIEPILRNKCLVCHGGNITQGQFDVGSHATLMKGGKRGQPIIPGKAAQSLLYQLAGKTTRPFMPPKSEEPLTPEELALIKLWIDQGARRPIGMGDRPRVLVGVPPASVHPVRALAVSPDKTPVIAAGRGNQIDLYESHKGMHLRRLQDPTLTTADHKSVKAAHLSIVEALAFRPDGKILASGSYGEVKLWDPVTGALRQTLTGFAAGVEALCFSPDGRLLATGGGAPAENGEIKVFDVASSKEILDIKNGHSDTVFGVAFSPSGKMLATCAADKFVKVFAIPEGKLLKTFEGRAHHVLDVGWKFDGKLLASAGADNVVKIWDFVTGEQVRTINAHSKQITRLVFIGKTSQFATCSGDRQVKMWNVDNGSNTRTFGGNSDFLYALGASADGTVLVTGGEEGGVRFYNGTTGQLIKVLLPP